VKLVQVTLLSETDFDFQSKHIVRHKMRPYGVAWQCAFDSVGIIYAWVLITESRTVLAETMSG